MYSSHDGITRHLVSGSAAIKDCNEGWRMISTFDKVENQLVQLVRITEQLIEIDLSQPEGIEQLEILQSEQKKITSQLQLLFTESREESVPDHIVELGKECIQLETVNVEKLVHYKKTVSNQLQSISGANVIRNSYNTTYLQSSGFFVDKHK
jgi:hypothetical protein